MSIYGYHRTSTQDQHLDRGIMEIENYCNNNNLQLVKIYTDQQTGKNFNRPRYMVLKEDVLRSGDILIISELDRLGRNKKDTLKELQYYKDGGIRVMILEIPTTLQDLTGMENSMAKMILDTINNMLIELYATIAQAEIEKKEKRQQEGNIFFIFLHFIKKIFLFFIFTKLAHPKKPKKHTHGSRKVLLPKKQGASGKIMEDQKLWILMSSEQHMRGF